MSFTACCASVERQEERRFSIAVVIHAETSLSEKNDKKETIPGEGTFGCGNEADPQRSNPRACACVPVMKCAAPGVTGDGPLPMEGQPGVSRGSSQGRGGAVALASPAH